MITVVAKSIVKDGKLDEALEICQGLIDETRKEEGCLKYELHQSINDKNIITFLEEWQSNGHLEDHMQTKHFTTLGPKLGELLVKDMEVDIYTKIK